VVKLGVLIELDEEEYWLITKIRENKLLRKAVLEYAKAMGGRD